MFPFHIWLPEAHVEAPTTGSVLLAGVLLKLGVYGFMRVHLGICYEASLYFSPLILTLSCLGVLLASFAAISQSDLKRLIAYSSVAHMNMLTMGIFSFQLEGLNGAILQCVSHAFVSSGLFFMVGSLYDRYHTKVIYYYGGLTQTMPLYALMLTFFNLANIALPGTSSFSAELMLLLGVYACSPLHCVVAGLSIFFGAVYSLWVNNRILFGLVKQSSILVYGDLKAVEFFILAILLCFTILLGIDTQLCFKLVDPYCIKLLR
jgi:NADH-quinone oxidoreductase subunit M